MTDDALLAVRDCSYAYRGGTFRLAGVDVDVRAREVLGVVGPNGSGKSTLLRLMAGLLRPTGGDVLLRGRPLRRLDRRAVAREMAFLPQDATTGLAFTARQVVEMGRYPHVSGLGFLSGHDVAVVDAALERADASGLADRRFPTLSGGERGRVLVAAVLAQEPAVMLLDEPTSALDIHHQAEVMDLLWLLSRAGIGVALVTHDLNAAGRFCDRLALLAEGRVAALGPPEDVLDESLLSRVYDADVRVSRCPVTGGPLVVVPGRSAHDAR